MDEFTCPICSSNLYLKSSFTLSELFDLWKPLHRFSEKVVQEHQKQGETTELFICNECGLEIFLPHIIGTENFYGELQQDPKVAYYVADKWDFSEAIKDVSSQTSLIEIGCGPGNFLEKARHVAREVCGTEYSESALIAAKAKGLEVFGFQDNIDAKKGNFNAAFSFHVLEHVDDPVKFVQEMLSWIKPGGVVGISVPNQDGPLKYVDSVMNMPPHHQTRWRLKTFLVLARKLNLRIRRVAYEPLLVENHNYYSYYWVNKAFSSNQYGIKILRRLLQVILERFFILISMLKIKYFKLLRGQAIYVLMEKPS